MWRASGMAMATPLSLATKAYGVVDVLACVPSGVVSVLTCVRSSSLATSSSGLCFLCW